MPNVERIDSIYNIPAITAEHETLSKILQQDSESIVSLYQNLETFQGKSNVGNVAKNWQNVSTAMSGASESSEALMQMQQKLNEQIARAEQLEKQLADALTKTAKARKTAKDMTDDEIRAKYEDTKATKDRTKEIISQTDAYKKLEFERDKAAAKAKTAQAKAIETGSPQDTAEANKLSAQANSLTNALKRIDQSVGESRRKVGDYTGAIRILEEELAEINVKMDNVRKSGNDFNNVLPKLSVQAQALTTVIGQQEKGFTSVTQQTRNAVRALETLQAAGLEGSEGFKRLQDSTAQAERQQRNFIESQRLLADNVPILRAMTIAAKGLAATYAISQGVVTLFSDGNEKLEKELTKLMAIMTILQGLQEVHELLEKSSAIATIFKTAATKAGIVMTGIDTVTTQANAAAKVEQAKATFAAAVSEADQAEAAAALAMAEAELTAATDSTAVAMGTLTTVLGATGIGVILIAVAAAIIFLIEKMKVWTAETQLDAKQQKELNDALAEQINSLQKIADLEDISSKKAIQNLQHQLDLEEKSGQNQYAIFAIKEKIAAKNARLAGDKYTYAITKAEDTYVKTGLTGVEALHKAQNDYFEDLTAKTYLVNTVQKELASVTGMTDRQRAEKGISSKDIDRIKERLDLAKSQQGAAQANFDFYSKAEENNTAALNEQENLRTEITKFSADERRKYILEVAKLEVDDQKDINERILSDQRSTLTQRLAAIQSNSVAERKLAHAEYENVKSNPATTDKERILAAKSMQETLIKIQRDTTEKQRDLLYQYYVRDRDAQLDIFKLQQTDRENQAAQVLADEKATFDQRRQAQYSNYEAQRQTLGAQFLRDIEQLGLTNEEKLRISKQYESDLLKLNIDYQKTHDDETKNEQQKQLQQLEQFYQRQKDLLTGQQMSEHADLNEQFRSGKIGPDTFERKRQQQDYEEKVKQQQLAVQQAFGNTQLYKEGTQQRIDAEGKLAQESMALNDLITNHELENQKKVKELRTEAYQEVFQAFGQLVDGAYEAELNQIQRAIDKNNKYKEVETTRIADSTLAEQQKAAAIEVINRQVEMNNEALQRRQRDIKIKQARFDRDAAVAETIAEGAIAAIAALKIPIYGEAEAIAIGIITAAKVAEILARPLPTYGYGTPDHPGGLAVVGDRYEKELIAEPGKLPYWSPSIPTVVDLAKHASVLPLSEIEKMVSDNMFVNSNGILIVDKKDNSKQIADAINKQTTILEKAIIRSRKIEYRKTFVDMKYAKYLEKQVYR